MADIISHVIESSASVFNCLNNDRRKMVINWSWIIVAGMVSHVPVLAAQQHTDKATVQQGVANQSTFRSTSSWQRTGSKAAVTVSSREISHDKSKLKKPPYRRIGNADIAATLAYPSLLPSIHCGVVNHIDFTVQPHYAGNMNTFIPGVVAIPFGRHGEKSFFTDVGAIGDSGYYPVERNIPEAALFRISLITDDGHYYVVTQRYLPRFQTGDTVRLNDAGFLERADCPMHDPNRRGLE
jgi:hypothetical protein